MRKAIVAVLLLTLSSCGGGPGGDVPGPSDPTVSGLDARPSNTSCLAGEAPRVSLTLQQVFSGLGSFSSPVLMLQEPASTAYWYVVQQGGIVYAFDNLPDVTTRRVFIDLTSAIAGASGGEMGLLGMAFHPGWPTDPRVYFSYTASISGQRVSRVVEYQTTDAGQSADVASANVILQINQPESNHNGGHIAFGPDGYLYIGFGDGGGGGDVHGSIGNGQRLSTLLGKMLRIDVDGAAPYSIPAGNPFAGNAVCNNDTGAFSQSCPEIFAYGFRNPWRWSFDRVTGELWVGDVGQGKWEEVDRVVAGGNYGWRCFEGNHDYNASCGSDAAAALPPVAEYSHDDGIAVTGGYVYRGNAIPELAGRYVFGDYGSGTVWHIARDTAPTLQVTTGVSSGINVSSFGEGRDGELYAVDLGGSLNRLVAGGAGGGNIPAQLSATGCVNAADATQPAPGLVPYAPQAPFWSDGAVKTRYLALPNGKQIGVGADGDFDFPTGSVLVKNFRLGSRLVETRLLMHHNGGEWAGYTYEWNAAGTDATRVMGGKTADIDGQMWLFPSEAQCLLCHTDAAGKSLGLESSQLNAQFHYTATGRDANQLATLNAIGMLTPALAQDPASLPAMPDPYGTSGTLEQRARAYLHTNCSQCHRPGGPTNVDMDLRYTTSLANTHACDVAPVNALGIANARRIAIGSNAAGRSLVIHRMALTDSDSMPPFQPRQVDAAGVQLLGDWVSSLANCN
jgi:uncharacterized repeat protein (TIGR03806 family)